MAVNRNGIRKRGTDSKGKSVWEINAHYVDEAGNPQRVYKTVHGTMKEAQKARAELLNQIEAGIDARRAETITFGEYAEQWLAERETLGELSPDTLERNRAVVKSICGYLGNLKLKQVSPRAIKGMYVDLKDVRGLAGSTLRKYHTTLKQILKAAVREDLILRNPVDKVDAPKAAKSDRKSLSQHDAHRLLHVVENAENEAYRLFEEKEARLAAESHGANRVKFDGETEIAKICAVRLGLATGARRGEVLALTWGNVDLQNMAIKIIASLSKRGEVKGTKTGSGERIVSIDAETAKSLSRLKSHQMEQLGKIGVSFNASTPVFCSAVGGFINPSNFSRWWKTWTIQNGFEGLLFHELRHTQATQLLANGADIKTVQSRLGHASASITLDFYAHAIPKNDRAAADLIGSLFQEETQPAKVLNFKSA